MKCNNGRAVIRYTTNFRKLKWSPKRKQYYANYSCVFNPILNCGDIETNPGPPAPETTTNENNSISTSVQILCPTCNQNVYAIAGLIFDLCKYWWHAKCLSFPRDGRIHSVSSHTEVLKYKNTLDFSFPASLLSEVQLTVGLQFPL